MKEADMWKYSMCLLFSCPKDNNKYQRSLFHTVIYPTPQVCTELGKPNRIYVYDLLKADNDNWLPKQFKHRKGGQMKKEIL